MKKYNKYYKLVTHFLPEGKVKQEVEYTGLHYICRLNKTEFIKRKVYFLALALCSIIIMISVGFLDISSSRVIYVAIPYACLFLPVVFNLIGVIRLIGLKDKLEFTAYDKSINRILRASVGQLVFSSIAVLGESCYLFIEVDREKLFKELVFLDAMILIFVSGLQLFRIRKMEIYTVEESGKNPV